MVRFADRQQPGRCRKESTGNPPTLLAGKNAEAEALVNETFTRRGAGSGRGGGARVPFGCYQALGDLHIVWKSNVESAYLNDWKWSVLDTEQFEDIRQRYREAEKQIAEATKPDADDDGWEDYQIDDGKVVQGDYEMKTGEWVVARHHLKLTKESFAQLGVLRISPADMNGSVHVNGQEVGRLAGWQALGNAKFERDVSEFLKPGDNSDEDEADPLAEILADELALMLV